MLLNDESVSEDLRKVAFDKAAEMSTGVNRQQFLTRTVQFHPGPGACQQAEERNQSLQRLLANSERSLSHFFSVVGISQINIILDVSTIDVICKNKMFDIPS